MLRKEFETMAEQMTAELKGIRNRFIHSGNKGDLAEAIFRDFLKRHLPRRFEVNHGEIVDRQWRRSKQCDVVVLNDNHPFTYTPDGLGLFFIEGVSGVGEVKMKLTSDEIIKTFKAAREYKKIQMILPSGARCYCSPADNQRYYIRPPFFLFAFESALNAETLVHKVLEEVRQDGDIPGASIDAIFVMDRNLSIFDLGMGDESFKIRNPETKEIFKGWKPKQSENVLFDFMAWFSIVIPVYSGGSAVLSPYLLPPNEK